MHPVALVYRFVLHTLAGVFLFSLVGGVAVLLNYGTVLIERSGVSPYATLAVRGLEGFLFVVDFLCIVVFVRDGNLDIHKRCPPFSVRRPA
jgi:hypothetical protein